MPIKVIVTRDFDRMSEAAAEIVAADILRGVGEKGEYNLGLATGNTPTGLYRRLAEKFNSGELDASLIASFNLDEYVGLPGANAQERTLHPESYGYFMIQELFGLLRQKFRYSRVPAGTLIKQETLSAEMAAHPRDWHFQGTDRGKAIVIEPGASSAYLRWIRTEILDAYREKILTSGGIDLQVVGVGGRGHVGFHEAGIPFPGNEMLLVELDSNTVENAVADGHFSSREDSPHYAVSMGAALIYRARTVLLMASGKRKTKPVGESLLMAPDCAVPISYGQVFARAGGRLLYVLDREAAEDIFRERESLAAAGVEIEDLSG